MTTSFVNCSIREGGIVMSDNINEVTIHGTILDEVEEVVTSKGETFWCWRLRTLPDGDLPAMIFSVRSSNHNVWEALEECLVDDLVSCTGKLVNRFWKSANGVVSRTEVLVTSMKRLDD
jgi:hypothetical protein